MPLRRVLATLLACVLPAVPLSAQQTDAPDPVGFSMSGGISKGAYQAGVLAVLFNRWHPGQDDPPHRFDANTPIGFAGASAGNINAVLGIIEWCRTQPQRADQSLFHLVWTEVGVQELIGSSLEEYRRNEPAQGKPGLERDDGLFSRAYFRDRLIPHVDSLVENGTFRAGCAAPIALMVNRFQAVDLAPSTLDVASEEAAFVQREATFVDDRETVVDRSAARTPIPTTRFAALMGAEVEDGELDFTTFPFLPQGRSWALPPVELGGWIMPASNPDEPGEEIELAFEQVLEVVLASSAFPVAFAPVRLDYWTPAYQQEEPPCNERMCRQSAYFWDGGTFDNHPLLAADRLARIAALNRGRAVGDSVRVISVDPNVRRQGGAGGVASAQATTDAVPVGLEQAFGIAGVFIEAARSYELQALARFDPQLIRRTVTSTRVFPIYGEKLSAFGAFLSKSFRELDFYIGAYDGAYMLADRFACDQGAVRTMCMLNELDRLATQLQLGPCGTLVYNVALGADFSSRRLDADSIRAAARHCRSLGPLRGETAGDALSAMLIQLAFDVTSDCTGIRGARSLLCEADLLALRDLLDAEGLSAEDLEKDEFLHYLLEDADAAADRLTTILIDRAWRAADQSTSEGWVEGGVEVGHALYEGIAIRRPERFEVAPGVTPRDDPRREKLLTKILPSAVRVTHAQEEGGSGTDILYIARFGVWRGLALDVRPRFEFGTDSRNFFPGGALTWVRPGFFSELTLGAEYEYDRETSLVFGTRLLADQVSIEIAHPLDHGNFEPRRLRYSFGLGDVPGLAYWIARIALFDS